jgi:hypothetical protein
MSQAPIKTTITKHGQRYVDEAVYVEPKPEGAMAYAMREAFGRPGAQRILVAYQMTRLNWVKPGGGRK